MEDNHIRVICRVRPANSKESNHGLRTCVQTRESNEVVLNSKPEPRTFTFDYSADSNATQEEIFEKIGVPITETVLLGYNGTILCYGQTGSGKTYTIFGSDLNDVEYATNQASPSRGLVPRVLEFIWNRISSEAEKSNGEKIYTCRCSFYEIYQEKVFDLLDNTSGASNCGGLSVREDSRHGVYVEGCIEEEVRSPSDASRVLAIGYRNRHVGETAMNRESSRSHAVFQLVVETSEVKGDVRTTRSSRFSMVDLAGSERQKDTNATGDRLKEASQINKSLSALGNVINALADVSSSGNRRHIHYRDSKLTFLLRDSLGGNSKTVLVATVSPADVCFAETLSTLKFAQRAKAIKNAAVVNEETRGSLTALQNEILSLKMQIAEFHAHGVSISTDVAKTDVFHSPCLQSDNKLMIKSELDVIKEALDRCQLADECKTRCESEVNVLSKRLAETEKSVLSTKMKLKMRDAEVKRLKSKDPAALADYQSTEEMVRVDVDAARQEMQSEVVRYKLMYEELQRRQELFERDAMPSWLQSQEVKFNHDVLQRLLQVESEVEEKFFKIDAATRCDFQNACGISVEEALDIRENYLTLKSTVEELRITNDASSLAISNAFNTIRELENSGSEYKLKAEQRIAELEGSCEEQAAKIASVLESLAWKSTEVEELRDQMCQMEGSLKRDKESSESARLMEYNKLMKDNMILLKNTRELQKYSTEKEFEIKEYEDQIEILQQEAEKTSMANHARTAQLEARINALENELSQSQNKVTTQASEISLQSEHIAVLSTEKFEYEENVKGCHSTIARLQKDLEKSNFELQNSQEDADSLYTQAETLIAELEEMRSELDQVNHQVSILSTNKQHLEESLASVNTSVADLTIRLEARRNETVTLEGIIAELKEELTSKKAELASIESEKRSIEESLVATVKSNSLLESSLGESKIILTTLQAERAEQDEVIRGLHEEMVSKTDIVTHLESSVTQLQLEISSLQTDISTSNATNHVLESGIISKQTEVTELKTEIENLTNQLNELLSENKTATETIVTLERRLMTKKSELTALIEEKALLKAQVDTALEMQQQLEMCLADASAQNDELGGQMELKDNIIATLEHEIEEGVNRMELSADKIKELEEEKCKISIQIYALKQSIDECGVRENNLQSTITTLQSALLATEEEKKLLTSTCDNLTEQLTQTCGDVSGLRNKVEELNCEVAEAENKFICKNNEARDLFKQCEDLQSVIDDQKWCLQKRQSENLELAAKLHELESDLITSKDALATAEFEKFTALENLANAQEDIRQLTCDFDNAKFQLAAVAELKDMQMKNLMETIQTQKVEISTLSQSTSDVLSSLSSMQSERDAIQQKFNSIRLAISAVTTSSPSSDLLLADSASSFVESDISTSIEQLRSCLVEKEVALGAMQEELNSTTTAHENSIKKIKSLERKSEKLQKHIEDLESTIDAFNGERITLQEETSEMKKQLALTIEKLDGLQVRLSESLRATEIAVQQKQDTEQILEKVRVDASRVEEERDELRKQNTEAAEHIIARKRELVTVRQELVSIRELSQDYESQIAELTKENAKLCGHQNKRQKIQLHMQLKKNIEDQMTSLKAMQDQLVRVSVERDNAIEECRQLKLAAKQISSKASSNKVTSKEGGYQDDGDARGKKKTLGCTTIVTRRRALMEANHADLSDAQEELEL